MPANLFEVSNTNIILNWDLIKHCSHLYDYHNQFIFSRQFINYQTLYVKKSLNAFLLEIKDVDDIKYYFEIKRIDDYNLNIKEVDYLDLKIKSKYKRNELKEFINGTTIF